MERKRKAEKIVELLRSQVNNIRDIAISTDSHGFDNKVYFEISFFNQVNPENFKLDCKGIKYNIFETRVDYSIKLKDFSHFARETYPFFEFVSQNFLNVAHFNRFYNDYDYTTQKWVQGSGFRLSYSPKIKEEDDDTIYIFPPSKRQLYPDGSPSEIVENILRIVKPRLKDISFAMLIMGQKKGRCRLLVVMDNHVPKRLKQYDGLSYIFDSEHNLFGITFDLTNRTEFSKVLWYFCSRGFAVLTDISKNKENNLEFKFVKMKK